MNWNMVRLADVSKIQTGKSNKEDAVTDGEYVFFDRSQTEQRSSRFLFDTEAIIVPGEGKEFIPRYFVGKFDLHQRVYAITDFNGINGKFLYYSILQNKNYFSQVAIGTTVKSLRKGMFERLELKAPSLHEQSQIVEILSSYDDLIENNWRRIFLLERAARLLYHEWFVNFRFPGHSTKFRSTHTPNEWEETTLEKVAKTNPETYTTKALPEQISYVDISSVKAGRIVTKKKISKKDAPANARRICKHGDIIWSNVRPNLKAYSLVLNPAPLDVFSKGFTVIRADAVPWSFLYLLVTENKFVNFLANRATGTCYPTVRADDFEAAKIILSDEWLLSEFHEKCEPIFNQINLLTRQNDALSKARDLLLPRLMDGRIKP